MKKSGRRTLRTHRSGQEAVPPSGRRVHVRMRATDILAAYLEIESSVKGQQQFGAAPKMSAVHAALVATGTLRGGGALGMLTARIPSLILALAASAFTSAGKSTMRRM